MISVVFCQLEAVVFSLLTKTGEGEGRKVEVEGLKSVVAAFPLLPLFGRDPLKCGTWP
jgi:hypothetical protein